MTSPLSFTECGSGPPLLLVHGLMATGEMFEPVIAAYSARFRVILPDLRGHGKSRGLPPPYTVEQLAADLAQLLDQLGIGTAAVLGYSQGGAIAQQFALDHPEKCQRLVLACTYAFNMASFREKIEGHAVPLLLHILGIRRFARLVIAMGLKQVSPERARWVTDMLADQDQMLMVAAWKAAMVFDSRERLHEIRCPTLVLAGSKDEAVPIHHAKMLHEGIAGSRLAVIEGADHALIWAHPEQLVQATESFLLEGAAR